jgi:arylsulfatase A-like enzyme
MNPRGRVEVALMLLLAVCLAACDGARDDPRPNLVLISVDTLRADALGAYGSTAPTPVFDGLATAGVLAEVAVAPAPETAPSHTTLLTGETVLRHGVTRNGVPLPEELETLASALQAAGYATGGFVSSFVLDPRFGWSRGFDHYDAHFEEDDATLDKQRPYQGAFWEGHEFEGLDRRAERTNQAVLRWLDDAPEPFFLFVHYFDPHMPYQPPMEHARALAGHPVDLRGRSFPGLSRVLLARLVRNYLAEVRYLDGELGTLVAAVHDKSAPERTLLVVTGDHGEGLGQHEWLEHAAHLYEEQVRVPLLWHWPGTLAPRRLTTPVGLVDVAPTAAELLGVPFAARDGHSLAAALLGAAEPEERPILGHRRLAARLSNLQPGEQDSLRTAQWKYIRASEADDELFDLTADPGELENLLAARPEVAAELAALLDAYLGDVERAGTPELDPETRRKLEALGYLD